MDRIQTLLDSLLRELAGIRAGSTDGQFPILDLLGNLRDASANQPSLQTVHALCSQSWERLVKIVEAGRGFEPDEIKWLKGISAQLKSSRSAGEPVPGTAQPIAPKSPAPPVAIAQADAGDEVPFELNIEGDGELLREFVNESREHLDHIEQGVLVLEHSPADVETLNTVFRAFHTFKGGAGFLNLLPVHRLAHVLESLLDLARQGKLSIEPSIIDLILGGRDVLKQFVDEIEGQLTEARPRVPIHIPIAKLKAEVLAVLAGVNSGDATPALPAPRTPEPTSAPAPAPAPPSAQPTPRSEPVGAAAAPQTETAGTVKLDTAKLDLLLDLVGETVIAQSLVAQEMSRLGDLNPQFARKVAQLSRITRELKHVSTSMRMVPVRGVFQKMARVVRDLAAKQNKKVQLVTSGEDAELDRGVVEELNDPLLHMIRNSIDHGIEAPEIRADNGKPAMATIHLRAYQQRGNIVLEVSDDGAGLNRERILAKAVERGLVRPGSQHCDEEIFALIFRAGFSTAEKVTEVSGRGVGLDVVRRNVERLRGCVDVSSTPGHGSVFKVSLPLTLAIIDGLVVKVGEERYIIPTLSVRESFRPEPGMLSQVQGVAEVVNLRGRLLPLLRLNEYFGVKGAATDPTQGIAVVVQSGANLRCLLVDSLLQRQEVVIKNLNDLMIHKNRALAGAAILGDGRVGLILDVNSLVHLETPPVARAA